jgi:hypothetical protein
MIRVNIGHFMLFPFTASIGQCPFTATAQCPHMVAQPSQPRRRVATQHSAAAQRIIAHRARYGTVRRSAAQ